MLGRRNACMVTLVLVGASCLMAQPRASLQPRCFAIQGARIVVEPGREIERGNLVLRDGWITAVGADAAIPPDALVMDGQGLTLYPGFIDAGNNWGIDLALRRSETGPPELVDYASEALAATKPDNRKGVTPEFQAATALKVDDEAAEGWRKQGFTARLAAPDAAFLAGQSVLLSLSGAAPRDAILKANVAQHAAFRAPGSGYPTTLMGSLAHLRQTLLDAQHHARLQRAFEENGQRRRPPLDPAFAALQPVLQQKQPLVFEADSRDAIHRALAFCDEYKLQPVLFGAEDAWKTAAMLKARQVPVLARINFLDEPRAAQGRRGPGPQTPAPSTPSETPQRGRRQNQPDTLPDVALAFTAPSSEDAERRLPKRAQEDADRRRKEEAANLAVLHQNGVRFAIATSGLERPEKFRENLRKAIAEGLPADAALRALTSDAAAILGVDKQLGTLAVGKAAHVVAMTGPFHDAKSQVRFVFADGVRFEYDAPGERQGPAARRDAPPREEPRKDAARDDEAKPAAEQATEIESDRKPKLRTGGNVLIHGATILTVANGRLKGDILVRDGKIAKVAASIPAPEGVTIIDAEGTFVMPGIIDTHCHYAIAGGVNEASLSIVPEVRIRDVVNSEDVQIYRALAGGVTTGRLLHGSANVIGGQDAVIKNKYGAPSHELLLQDAPRGIKFALGENVKRTDGRFPNTRLGVEAVLVRAFTEA